MKRRTFHVEHEVALGALLKVELGEQGLELIRRGAVYVDGRRLKELSATVKKGQTVMAVLEEGGVSSLSHAPKPPALEVVFEDSDLIAVNKHAGVTAQPTPSREGVSLLDLVTARLQKPAGLVHRLDKETSGITVFGKNDASTSALAAAFREGTAHKRYFAITGPGIPLRGTIDLPLSKDPSRPGRWRATTKANGIDALTDFQRLYEGRFCIVVLFPKTGRTHQLRAHLTALGCPILGDSKYGGAPSLLDWSAPRCLLHAYELTVPHPRTGEAKRLRAPLPEDIAVFFRAANLDPILEKS